MIESSLEHKLVLAVEKHSGYSLKFNSPGRRGVPDRLVLFPGGQACFVEVKATDKPLGPLQKKWAARLREKGFRVYKIDSAEGIKAFIEKEAPRDENNSADTG